jgi:hypothetical protein
VAAAAIRVSKPSKHLELEDPDIALVSELHNRKIANSKSQEISKIEFEVSSKKKNLRIYYQNTNTRTKGICQTGF